MLRSGEPDDGCADRLPPSRGASRLWALRFAPRVVLALAVLAGSGAAQPEPSRLGPRLERRLQRSAPADRIPIQVVLARGDLPAPGQLRRDLVRERQERALASTPAGSFQLRRRYVSIAGLAGWARPDAITALLAQPDVEHVYLDGVVHATTLEGGALVGADLLVSQGFAGAGVNVALLDSGIDSDHPSLVDSLVAQQCFCDDHPSPSKGCCANGDDDMSGPGAAEDATGHGTAMAGVVTSNDPSSPGVAPASGIVAVKVLSPTGSFSDVDAGLDWVLTHHASLDIRVVNMSLGDAGEYEDAAVSPCSGSNTAVVAAALVDAGVVVVASSGNNGFDFGVSYPACVPAVIAVGGVYDTSISNLRWCLDPSCQTTCTDTAAPADSFVCHTNSGSLLEVLAPDWMTRTAGLDGGSATIGGTSISSAYVSAQAALLASVDPSLSAQEIRTLLGSYGPMVVNPDNNMSFRRSDVNGAYGDVLEALDSDADGVLDDGDGSGALDATCTGGQTEGCDDNCRLVANPGQADGDADGIGDACDVALPALAGLATALLAAALVGSGLWGRSRLSL